jgi:hypothetical protein
MKNDKVCKRCLMVTPHDGAICTVCTSRAIQEGSTNLNQQDMAVLLYEVLYQAQVTDARLTILMDWCRTFQAFDFDRDGGMLEQELTRNHTKSVHKIGEYLEEIFQMDEDSLFKEALKIKLKR